MGSKLFWGLFLSGIAFAEMQTTREQVLAVTSLGTSEIYAGGDPRMERLASVREQLNQAIRLIQARVGVNDLCSIKSCAERTEPDLCYILQQLSEEKRDHCRRFLISKAEIFLRMNVEQVTPFRLSSIPLHASGLKRIRSVAALTNKEPRGEIVFHDGSVRGMSERQVLSLMTHELGHKVVPSEGNEKFLDLVGAAVGLFAPEYVAATQAAPPLPEGVSQRAACALVRDDVEGGLVGMVADFEGTVPSVSRLAAWHKLSEEGIEKVWRPVAQQLMASDAARLRRIRGYFSTYLRREPSLEEMSMMAQRMATGETSEAVIAAVVGDDEYANSRGVKGDERFLGTVFVEFLGREPFVDERAKALPQLQRHDRPSWVLAFLKAHPEVARHQVGVWYRQLLNRQPTTFELEKLSRKLLEGGQWDIIPIELASGPEYRTLQRKRWLDCTKEKSVFNAGMFPVSK